MLSIATRIRLPEFYVAYNDNAPLKEIYSTFTLEYQSTGNLYVTKLSKRIYRQGGVYCVL